jgi:hypothetical protein
VETEYTIGNDGSHGEVIKGISKVLPNIGISVLPEAFVVKSVAGMFQGRINEKRSIRVSHLKDDLNQSKKKLTLE